MPHPEIESSQDAGFRKSAAARQNEWMCYMSIIDQDGNEPLQPSYQKEKRVNEDVWAAYKFQRGFHDGERVTGYMTLDSAMEKARKRNEEIGDREDYSFVVYRLYRHTKRRVPQKPGPRKR